MYFPFLKGAGGIPLLLNKRSNNDYLNTKLMLCFNQKISLTLPLTLTTIRYRKGDNKNSCTWDHVDLILQPSCDLVPSSGCSCQTSQPFRKGDCSKMDSILLQFLSNCLRQPKFHVLLLLIVIQWPLHKPRTIWRAVDIDLILDQKGIEN